MRDLIFISMEDWDDYWRRNQFVCAELARRHPGNKILFLGVPRNLWRHLGAFDLGPMLRSPVSTVPNYPNIITSRALRVGLERFQSGVHLNESITRRHLQQLAAKFGLNEPVLWLNPHWAGHLIGHMNESAVIYDITDDWISREQPAWLAEQTRRQDADLCRRADAVIVCSQKLQEMKLPLAGERVHCIPNGVDAEHYLGVLDGSGPLPASASAWERPVYGYTGTIHADRLDLDLIHAVAQKLIAGSLVFLGPDHLSAAQRGRLQETGRVSFHDAVPYTRIPQYMRGFDVCITPHKRTPFVESLQPIKLWEYLASGKPIVATKVSGFRDFPELVRLAEGPDEFARQLLAAGSEDAELAPRRRQVAAANSWSARVDAVERVFDSVAPSPQSVRRDETILYR